MLLASRTLEKARLFAQQAASATPNDPKVFASNFEASIVFARSVTFHLQKQLASLPDFQSWYGTRQVAMREDPVMRLFKNERNFILKEGPARVASRRRVIIEAEGQIQISGELSIKVIRGSPWYKRSPAIIWQDLSRDLVAWVRSKLPRRLTLNKSAVAVLPTKVSEEHVYFFDEDGFRERPAFELLNEFLDRLEKLVREAESEFASLIDESV